MSQPPTPSPSLYPLLQLGDLEDTAPGDKVRSVSMSTIVSTRDSNKGYPKVRNHGEGPY